MVVIGVAVFALEKTGRIDLLNSTQSPSTNTAPGNINFNPPTEEEKEAGNQQKEASTDSPATTPTDSPTAKDPVSAPSKGAVKPIIASAGAGDVRGYVPNITENGGTCTATFTGGGQTVTKTSPTPAFADAQRTICPPIDYSGTAVAAGWNVTLTYKSASSEGISDASPVQ